MELVGNAVPHAEYIIRQIYPMTMIRVSARLLLLLLLLLQTYCLLSLQ